MSNVSERLKKVPTVMSVLEDHLEKTKSSLKGIPSADELRKRHGSDFDAREGSYDSFKAHIIKDIILCEAVLKGIKQQQQQQG